MDSPAQASVSEEGTTAARQLLLDSGRVTYTAVRATIANRATHLKIDVNDKGSHFENEVKEITVVRAFESAAAKAEREWIDLLPVFPFE